MALYLIERNFAQELQVTDEAGAAIKEVNAELGVNWLFSFLSADKKKTYCLYECADIDLLRRHAADLGIPADVITQVDEWVR